jgi:hypothetical protein
MKLFCFLWTLVSLQAAWAVEPKNAKTAATAAVNESGVTFKEPVFLNEPNRKLPQPVQPETYVEGPDTPPVDDPSAVAPIPREHRDLNVWWHTLDFGWYFTSQNSTHSFTGASNLRIKTSNANMLSVAISYEAIAPKVVPLSGHVKLFGTSGSSEGVDQSSTINRTNFSVQDFRAIGGISFHPLSRKVKSDLRLTADIEFGYVSIMTLTNALNNIDVNSRMLMFFVPRLEYRYHPNQNWSAFASVGMGLPMSLSGENGVTGTLTRRIESDLGVVRYLAKGSALGASVNFGADTITWVKPSINLSDEVYTTELRLNLFWRCDI